MKTITLTSVLVLCAIGGYAQWQLGYGMQYTHAQPTRGMGQNISRGGGVNLYFEVFHPDSRVVPLFDMTYIVYGRDKTTQTYEFGNGTFADMNVVVSNDMMTLSGGLKILLRTEGLVIPYATVKAGRAFFTTNLAIYDPDDGDDCEPVDSDILHRDATWTYSAGGGVRIDFASMFRRAQPGKVFLDLSANSIQGGRVSYMNVDAPSTAGNHSLGTRYRNVDADFINTQTQVVHKHHVGYLYSSFVQLVDFRVGLSLRLDNALCRRRMF